MWQRKGKIDEHNKKGWDRDAKRNIQKHTDNQQIM